MRDEVEEFLRRAAARRAQAEQKRREQMQQAAQQPPPPQRPAPIQRAPLRSAPPPQPQKEDLVEIIDAEVADTSSRFDSSVAQHLRSTSEISQHASRLGVEVDQADDKLQARLNKTFDHKIGQLQDTTTSGPTKQATAAAENAVATANLLRMLTNQQSIRNAVILGEVLQRPEHRWD